MQFSSDIIDPFKLPKSRTLFLFAHPDDEVFISGLMMTLLENNVEILCVWATSGDFFGGGEKREAENLAVIQILNLPMSQRKLLRIPDLGLIKDLHKYSDQIASLIKDFHPTSIFVNAYEGGHPDHDCVNFLAYEGRFRSGLNPKIYEFPLYNGNGKFIHWWWQINSFPNEENQTFHFPINKKYLERKYAIMRAYGSQWMYMIPARLVSPEWRLMGIGELYRLCPDKRDHSLPPHPRKLNYERWFNYFMHTSFYDYKQAVLNCRTFNI
jgi:LmbE family N-acetylglucosaminyl deacetylase